MLPETSLISFPSVCNAVALDAAWTPEVISIDAMLISSRAVMPMTMGLASFRVVFSDVSVFAIVLVFIFVSLFLNFGAYIPTIIFIDSCKAHLS